MIYYHALYIHFSKNPALTHMPVSNINDKIRKNNESEPRFDKKRNRGDNGRFMNFPQIFSFQIEFTAFDVDLCDKTFISSCFFDKSENKYE